MTLLCDEAFAVLSPRVSLWVDPDESVAVVGVEIGKFEFFP
jgi:hypothetical protein